MSTPRRPDLHPTSTTPTTSWPRRHPALTTILGIIAVVVIVGSMADADGPVPPTGGTSSGGGPPEVVALPDVMGSDLPDARAELHDAGMRVSVKHRFSKQPSGTVLDMTTVGDAETPGSLVTVVVAQPYPRLRSVVGDRFGPAAAGLRQAGYRVRVRRLASARPAGTVLRQTPGPGTSLLPGKTVVLVVAKPMPAPSTSGGSCHPSYTGACLDPSASDYDCAGGSGDGPRYTGTVRVVGPDEYGLDADHDGYGCE